MQSSSIRWSSKGKASHSLGMERQYSSNSRCRPACGSARPRQCRRQLPDREAECLTGSLSRETNTTCSFLPARWAFSDHCPKEGVNARHGGHLCMCHTGQRSGPSTHMPTGGPVRREVEQDGFRLLGVDVRHAGRLAKVLAAPNLARVRTTTLSNARKSSAARAIETEARRTYEGATQTRLHERPGLPCYECRRGRTRAVASVAVAPCADVIFPHDAHFRVRHPQEGFPVARMDGPQPLRVDRAHRPALHYVQPRMWARARGVRARGSSRGRGARICVRLTLPCAYAALQRIPSSFLRTARPRR